MAEPKMTSAGYIALDITPTFPKGRKQKSLKEILRPGSLVEVGEAKIAVGGSVSNTGLALYKFGADTKLIAKIGKDNFGSVIVEEYRKHGVEPSFIISEEDSTSYTLAIAPPGCDRIFLTDPGANNTLNAQEILDSLEDTEYFHFGYPTIMKKFFEDGGRETERLFRHAKGRGMVTSLDLTVVDQDSLAGQQDWKAIFRKVLPYVDFFVPSFEESCALFLPEKCEELRALSDGDDLCLHLSLGKDVKPLAEEIMKYGCKGVLIKCGAAGLYLKTGDQALMDKVGGAFKKEGWGSVDYFAESYVPDRIASGTGAGDTAIAAFLYSMAKGFTPEECANHAAGTGAMNITEYDSLSGILPIPELMKKIASGWERQHLIAE